MHIRRLEYRVFFHSLSLLSLLLLLLPAFTTMHTSTHVQRRTYVHAGVGYVYMHQYPPTRDGQAELLATRNKNSLVL